MQILIIKNRSQKTTLAQSTRVFSSSIRILTSLFYTHYYYTSHASFPLHGIECFNFIFDFIWLMSLVITTTTLHRAVYVSRRVCIIFLMTCYFTLTEPGSLIFLYCDANSVLILCPAHACSCFFIPLPTIFILTI